MDGAARMMALRAAAQDHRIAGFETQGAGIRCYIGPAFINDADDAKGHAPTLDMQT